MKIVYVTNYRDITVGGDSRVAWELARSFADNTDNEVWMIKPGNSFRIERDRISKRLNTYSFPSDEIDLKFHLFHATTSNIRKLFKFLKELDPDVIHGHLFDPVCYICQSWALKEEIPFIYTAHVLPSHSMEFIPGHEYIRAISRILKIPYTTYTRSFYTGCSSIITLNESAQEDFRNFLGSEDQRYDTIPNGTYLQDAFFPEREPPNDTDPIKLIFVGHISSRKNQAYILESLKNVKSLRNIQLLLAGSHHDSKYSKEVLRLASELEESRERIHVSVPGHIDHKNALEEYKRSHYLISASLMEVQSLVIIEALASGLPIVALENETVSELVENDKVGFVVPSGASTNEFAKHIDKIINIDSKTYSRFSKNALEAAKGFDWVNIVLRTESLYQDIISSYKAVMSSRTESGLERIIAKIKLLDNSEAKNVDHTVIEKKNRFINLSIIAGIVVSFLAFFNIGTSIKRSSKKIKKAVRKRVE